MRFLLQFAPSDVLPDMNMSEIDKKTISSAIEHALALQNPCASAEDIKYATAMQVEGQMDVDQDIIFGTPNHDAPRRLLTKQPCMRYPTPLIRPVTRLINIAFFV